MFVKIFSTTCVLVALCSPVWAGHIILTAQDPSPATLQCDQFNGSNPPNLRFCYIPQYGPAPDIAGPFVQSHNGAFPPIVVTLSTPTTVKISYRQLAFLNSEIPNNCRPGLPSCAAYLNAIGVGGTAPQNVCGGGQDGNAVAAGGGIGILGAQGYDVPFAAGVTVEAICVITLPVGSTPIYAMESAREGADVFDGPGEQLLIVEYDQ